MTRSFLRFRKNLFLKIIGIFILAHILSSIVIAFSYKYAFENYSIPKMMRFSTNYGQYIFQEIGTPPDTSIARKISELQKIDILIENDSLAWQTASEIQDYNSVKFFPVPEKPAVKISRPLTKRPYIMYEKSGTRYVLSLQPSDKGVKEVMESLRLLHMIIFSLIMIGAYFLLQALLHPIRKLHRAILQLSTGNLNIFFKTRRIDELGQLMKAFDDMTLQIRHMLKAREQLLLDVSHELRSPITRMKLALEFLPPSDDKQNLRDDVHEMELMITEILESARLSSEHGSLQRDEHNIIDILNTSIADYSNGGPAIERFGTGKPIFMSIDPQRIKILFNNILANAVKYSKQNGPAIRVTVKTEKHGLKILIQDFGIGIPSEDLLYVFEPFYRVDKSRTKGTGGYGLGMSLCRDIMQAHGGSIEISSEEGKGTTIQLFFPNIEQKK